jgi:hypothetical protein
MVVISLVRQEKLSGLMPEKEGVLIITKVVIKALNASIKM